MTIIITNNGKEPKKIEESKFDDEDKLQQYIYNAPESIPLYEIDEDIRLLILAREFGTSSGPIDAIGLDQDGEIYVIETKLYKNPDKRLVLAQVLDYGAAIAKDYRDFGNFIIELEKRIGSDLDTIKNRIRSFFGLTENESSILLENLKNNIFSGNFRFVVLMDKLYDQLKNLILFINQNSQFSIYAVELKYYKYENLELTIPKLFGTEVKKSTAQSPSTRKKWNENMFFEHAESSLKKEQLASMQKLYDFSKKYAKVSWGSGAITGSFNTIFENISPRSLYSVYSDGRMSLNFHWLHDDSQMEHYRDEFKNKMSAIAGLKIPSDYRDRFVYLDINDWYDKVGKIIDGMKSLIK